MKTVFSNAKETVHVWAQQTQSEGRSSNVFFEGATLYSYGYHYPLGLIATNKKGEKAAIINDAGYSVTTTKHIGVARYAVNHYRRFSIPDTTAMKALVGAQRFETPSRAVKGLSEAIEHTIKGYLSKLRNDAVRRKGATLEKWKDETLAECQAFIDVLEWLGEKMTPSARKALKDVTGATPSEAQEQARKAAAREAQRRAKEQAEKDKRDAIAIKAAVDTFLRGDTLSRIEKDYLERAEPVVMRVSGEDVETSKGVLFPIGHAVKAWALIQTVMTAGEAWQRNGKTLHLGHYQVDRIEPDGTVIAGCHTVHFGAIKFVAKQLKLV